MPLLNLGQYRVAGVSRKNMVRLKVIVLFVQTAKQNKEDANELRAQEVANVHRPNGA